MWRTAKELLHLGIVKHVLSPEESSKLAKSFTKFFTNKIQNIGAKYLITAEYSTPCA